MAHILPNDIIMRIIREADGGRHTNKLKMDNVLSHLNKVIGQANCQYTSEVYGSLYVCFCDDCWWGDARYTMWVKTPEWLEELGREVAERLEELGRDRTQGADGTWIDWDADDELLSSSDEEDDEDA